MIIPNPQKVVVSKFLVLQKKEPQEIIYYFRSDQKQERSPGHLIHLKVILSMNETVNQKLEGGKHLFIHC